jgi:hypothetical protein
VPEGFWQKRVSRRRLLTGTASAALIGGGAALFLPRRLTAGGQRASLDSPAPLDPFVTAEDIIHTPAELASGEFRALRWDSLDGQTGLRAAAASEGLYTSPVVRTNNPFTHVGLHWRTSGPQTDGVHFDLRTSADGRAWSAWRPATVETYPEENPRGESFAGLVWAGDARFVQYSARFDAETQDSPLLSYVVVTALNAAPPSPEFVAARTRKKTATPRATAVPTSGPVSGAGALPPPFDDDYLLTREEWGAPDSYRFYTNGAEVWPRMYVPTKKIVVHHTATLDGPDPDPSYTADQAVQDVRAVYYYHAITKGWGDIGYNALIDRFGRIYEGRRGRDQGPDGQREIISSDVVAGHALNCNEGSVGVSLIGNFEVNRFDTTYLAPMQKTLLDFLTWQCRRHYIAPTESSDFLMVNYYRILNLPNICGHRDCNTTACPGDAAYARLPEWRSAVADQVSDAARVKPSAQLVQTPSQADVDRGYVTFSWKSSDSASALFSYYLEGWIGNLDDDSVYYITGFTGDKRPAWSEFSSNTTASFTLKEPGRYTFHVRAKDPSSGNEGAYEENYTFVNSSERTFYRIGAPGTTKN